MRYAPAQKIFKTAPPHPENAPSLTLTPPQPEIFFFCSTLKLPCASRVAPLEKKRPAFLGTALVNFDPALSSCKKDTFGTIFGQKWEVPFFNEYIIIIIGMHI